MGAMLENGSLILVQKISIFKKATLTYVLVPPAVSVLRVTTAYFQSVAKIEQNSLKNLIYLMNSFILLPYVLKVVNKIIIQVHSFDYPVF